MTPRSETTALILAAGRGARAGGPKALLLVDGEPLALLHARRRLAAESGRVVVVCRAPVASVLRARCADARVAIVTSHAEDALGPAGSIAAAVRADALRGARTILVSPVDMRPADARSTAALLRARGQSGVRAARFAHGHPVACAASLLEERYRDGAPRLRDVLASVGAACAVLPMPADERVSDDLDDASRITNALGAAPSFVAWEGK